MDKFDPYSHRTWIWNDPNWAKFKYDAKALEKYQTQFDFNANNMLSGVVRCDKSEQEQFLSRFKIEVTGMEAYYSSKIEGHTIHPNSIINGLSYEFSRTSGNSEKHMTITRVMADIFINHDQPLTEERLHQWNMWLTENEDKLKIRGNYRTHKKDMIIKKTAKLNDDSADFVAPPSDQVPDLMKGFIEWYEKTAPSQDSALPSLVRAGLAHLYFVTIHPYEDGNGRASRAIAEKCLSESRGQPTLISLSHAISKSKGEYLEKLRRAQEYGDIDEWLEYFSKTAIEAQELTRKKMFQALIREEIQKNVIPDTTPNQEKALIKMIDALNDDQRPEKGITLDQYKKMSGTKKIDDAKAEMIDLIQRGVLVKQPDKDRWELNGRSIYDFASSSNRIGSRAITKPYKKPAHGTMSR